MAKKSYLMIHLSENLTEHKKIKEKIKKRFPISDIGFEEGMECDEISVNAEDDNPEYEEKAKDFIQNIVDKKCEK